MFYDKVTRFHVLIDFDSLKLHSCEPEQIRETFGMRHRTAGVQ